MILEKCDGAVRQLFAKALPSSEAESFGQAEDAVPTPGRVDLRGQPLVFL